MSLPAEFPFVLGSGPNCWNPDHFQVIDGALVPQSWMQWRHVASIVAGNTAGDYPATVSTKGAIAPIGGVSVTIFGTLEHLFGGLLSQVTHLFGSAGALVGALGSAPAAGNKNDLIHDIQTAWTNDSPIDQWVYGKITRGGSRVTLQARSRGGLLLSSGYQEAEGDAGALVAAGMFGCGADLGNSGSLNIGTKFGMIEVRQHARTIPLAPERVGWHRLAPAATLTARCQLRFISEYWETTTIDGGNSGTESSYETGDTRLDLFAVPALD